MTEPRWFPSKVDWWLAVILALGPAFVGYMTIMSLFTDNAVGIAILLGTCAFMAAIYLGVVFPVRYAIVGDELVIRHGLFRQRCKLAEIREVRPTHNPLSAPALSLDRLRIQTGEGALKFTLISPREKEEFLGLLAERAGLAREGDKLVRR
jgi:membrane protein YdbS with pleckstrin-like domain